MNSIAIYPLSVYCRMQKELNLTQHSMYDRQTQTPRRLYAAGAFFCAVVNKTLFIVVGSRQQPPNSSYALRGSANCMA